MLLQGTGAFTEDGGGGGVHYVDYGGGDAVAGAGVDEEGDVGFIAVGYFHHRCVVVVAVAASGDDRGGEERTAEGFGKATRHVVVRYSHAYFLASFEYFREGVGRREYECERTGKVAAHDVEGVVVDAGEAGGLAQVGAHDGEILPPRVDSLYAAHMLDGALVGSVAADGIERVGGIDNRASVFKCFDGFIDKTHVDVSGVDAERFHCCIFY